MKRATRILAALLCVLLLLPTLALAESAPSLKKQIAQSAEGMSALGGKKGDLLKDRELFPAGDSVCDWLAMAMALSGAKECYSDYLAALKAYVEDAYAKNGYLDRNKATEYHRIALTVLALGGDPTHFGTKPDGSAIDLIAEGTYNYARDPGAQGLNGWIWALLALDAKDTEVPDDARYSREDMVNAIVIAQEPDGGFGLIPGKSDVDITAMAVQALAPYEDQLETEIDAALSYLSGQLTDTCGYIAYDDENAESTAQVILALCALGIDPETDSRFVKGEYTPLTELSRFREADGTYRHVLEGAGDGLATAQSVLALVAVQRVRSGQPWVLHFDGAQAPREASGTNGIIICAVIGAVVVIAAGAIYIIGRKRKKA